MAQLGVTGLDLAIIAVYLVSVTAIGLAVRRRAAKSVESYLLGDKSLPWYMLGLSNASGMFDISGTMWLVTIGFVYGLKSIWLPWLWPTFNQIFLMVFLSAWLRRSNVTTGAQWIETRFGNGVGARLSHMVVVIFALIGGLGFLAYGFVGLGKFVEIFLPWEIVQPWLGISVSPEHVPHLYGIVFTLVAVAYTVLGGMRSHRARRRPPVHDHDHLGGGGGGDRHDRPGCQPPGRARRLDEPVVRLGARPRLERDHRRGQPEDRRPTSSRSSPSSS